MNVKVVTAHNFRREAKKYLKKFHGLKSELAEFGQSLLVQPRQGKPLTENSYKIRLGSKSKGKGKSGGFRVITYIVETEEVEGLELLTVVTLLSIYDKSETETLTESEIRALIETHHARQANADDEAES